MSSLLFDTIVLIILLIFVVSGYNQGFIKALLSFLGAVISFGISVYISSYVANYIYANFIEYRLIDRVNEILLSDTQGLKEQFEGIPRIILNGFQSYGITFEKINHIIINEKSNAAGSIVNLFSPIMINFIKVISTTFLFSVFMVMVNIITKTIRKVFRLPILKQIDGLMGAIFGFLKGYVVLIVIMVFIRIVLPSMSKEQGVYIKNSIDSTYIIKNLYYDNPAYGLFRKI